MSKRLSLSEAKAHLSEVVRNVRLHGEEVVLTVDGEPAARLTAIQPGPRALSPAEIATQKALMSSLGRLERPQDAFDAVALVQEGRR